MRAMVDVARSTDTVCLPTVVFQQLVEKIDCLTSIVKNQNEQLADLEARLKNEIKMREKSLAERIDALGSLCTTRDRLQNEEKLSMERSNVAKKEAKKEGMKEKQSRSSSENQKSRSRRSMMFDREGWYSEAESEEREEERKREQSNGTSEKATGEHKSYSRIAQVRLSSPKRTNIHKLKLEKVMTGRRGRDVPHRLCGIRMTTRGSTSRKTSPL